MEDLGGDVLTAPDAESALELAVERRPDVVITDIRLPGESGLTLAEKIEQDEQTASTCVILMSASGSPRDFPDRDFIPRPFDLGDLEDMLAPLTRGPKAA